MKKSPSYTPQPARSVVWWFVGHLSSLLTACGLFYPEDPPPAYLQMDQVAFTGEAALSDHNISDAWVFVENKFVGLYELPARFPVLASGPVQIEIQPGVFPDGQRGQRQTYPFFVPFRANVVLREGETFTLNATTNYLPNVQTPLNETFELENLALDSSAFSDWPLRRVDTLGPPTGGAGFVGVMVAPAVDSVTILEVVSRESYPLPAQRPVFLEFQYRASVRFEVGLFVRIGAQRADLSELVLFPTDEWRKVYVNLVTEINAAPANSTFQVFFRSLAEGQRTDYLALDNVRLVFTQ